LGGVRLAIPNRITVGILVGLILAGAAFWWLCDWSENVAFLPTMRGAEWIIYPKKIESNPRRAFQLFTVFDRSFSATGVPSKAVLTFCAFKAASIVVNDKSVPLDSAGKYNWKTRQKINVASFLQAGTNRIRVAVTNSSGPPALWLQLSSPEFTLKTDETWQASLSGSLIQPASPAKQPPIISAGTPFYGSETLIGCLRRRWLRLVLVATLMTVLVIGVIKCQPLIFRVVKRDKWPWGVLMIVLCARALLFVHNEALLPRTTGFDTKAHEEYIGFLLSHNRLPSPNEGWEMYQPPLYYATCALILSFLDLSPNDQEGLMVLHIFNGLVGLLLCWTIMFSLRLLFPDDIAAQAVGLVAAAFLPPNVYLSQYVTNEVLAACLTSMALLLALYVMPRDKCGVLLFAAIGAVFGAAMLTKVSSALILPGIVVALVIRSLFTKRSPYWNLIRTVGILFITCFIVCGWYFVGVGLETLTFGGATASGHTDLSRWQDPGFRTLNFYATAGHVFAHPLYSATQTFADGIYSTLFGDGLLSGAPHLFSRPPWNYDWMCAAYLLAIVPCTLALVGFSVSAASFVRNWKTGWSPLLSVMCFCAFGLAYFSLRIPWYSTVKAFYALSGVLAFSAFVSQGWQYFARKHVWIKTVLLSVLAVWAVAVYASFWIRPLNPQIPLTRGLSLAEQDKQPEAISDLQLALQLDKSSEQPMRLLPQSRAQAHLTLGMLLSQEHRETESIQEYRLALSESSDLDMALNNLAWLLVSSPNSSVRNGAEAVSLAERACTLTQYRNTVYIGTLAAACAEAGRFEEAVSTAQLAVNCARLRNEDRVAEVNLKLMELYRAGKSLRGS
jgi:tetratricopeptide (TPR) repeat protein